MWLCYISIRIYSCFTYYWVCITCANCSCWICCCCVSRFVSTYIISSTWISFFYKIIYIFGNSIFITWIMTFCCIFCIWTWNCNSTSATIKIISSKCYCCCTSITICYNFSYWYPYELASFCIFISCIYIFYYYSICNIIFRVYYSKSAVVLLPYFQKNL